MYLHCMFGFPNERSEKRLAPLQPFLRAEDYLWTDLRTETARGDYPSAVTVGPTRELRVGSGVRISYDYDALLRSIFIGSSESEDTDALAVLIEDLVEHDERWHDADYIYVD